MDVQIAALVVGYALDLLLGDPLWLPHPIVLFGRLAAIFERIFNRGKLLLVKGALVALLLVVSTFGTFWILMVQVQRVGYWLELIVAATFVFFGLANRTLIREVVNVFKEEAIAIEKGRIALSRIVGRDTQCLNSKQVKKAALETLSENLSDGVVAPLFYFGLFGIPGIMAYKMVNTLDSMWGYKNERYLLFGRAAARIDDIANFIPARITALLMAFVSLSGRSLMFAIRYGRSHSSPNSGYPEAALAGILNCQFGGGSYYGGSYFDKPTIGEVDRDFTLNDMRRATDVNHLVALVMVVMVVLTLHFL